MQQSTLHESSTRWYQNFWAWVVIAIPVIAVVAGITTIIVASNTRDSLVSDDYYREGLAINQRAARQQLAREKHISADLDLRSEGGDMRIVLHGEMKHRPLELTLNLFHPTLQEYDVDLRFRRRGDTNEYHAPAKPLRTGRWDVLLQPDDATWRIQGKLQLLSDDRSPIRLMP